MTPFWLLLYYSFSDQSLWDKKAIAVWVSSFHWWVWVGLSFWSCASCTASWTAFATLYRKAEITATQIMTATQTRPSQPRVRID